MGVSLIASSTVGWVVVSISNLLGGYQHIEVIQTLSIIFCDNFPAIVGCDNFEEMSLPGSGARQISATYSINNQMRTWATKSAHPIVIVVN